MPFFNRHQPADAAGMNRYLRAFTRESRRYEIVAASNTDTVVNRLLWAAKRHHRHHVLQRRGQLQRYKRASRPSQAARWRRYRQYPPHYLSFLQSIEPLGPVLKKLATLATETGEHCKRIGDQLRELRGA